MNLKLRQLICQLYVEQQISVVKICDYMAERCGMIVDSETVKRELVRGGVQIRTSAEAQFLRKGRPDAEKLISSISHPAPVKKRPLAELPIRDAGGIPWPTRDRLMAGR